MVAHVEPGAQRTLVVSFPRDLDGQRPGLPGKNRINAAYGTGGPQAGHRHAEGQLRHRHPPLRRGRLQELPGRRRRDRRTSACTSRTGARRETGLNIPIGPGCVALDGGDGARSTCGSRSMQILDPNGSIVDPDTGQHWRLLDVRADLHRIPRQQDFIRKLAGVAIAKSLSDPFLALQISDNVLGDIKADQRARARRRERADPRVQDHRRERPELGAVRDASHRARSQQPERRRSSSGHGADELINQLRTFGDNTPPPPSVVPSAGEGAGARRDRQEHRRGHADQARAARLPTRRLRRRAKKTTLVSEIHYAPEHLAEAKALLPFVADCASW